MNVSFYPLSDEKPLKYSVIVARYGCKWVFCRHKRRDTLEIPGGHIEKGETALQAARRELYEETGAAEYDITPVCIYGYSDYGMLFYAVIKRFEPLPESEISEIVFTDGLPQNLTYPAIQPWLYDRVIDYLKEEKCQL